MRIIQEVVDVVYKVVLAAEEAMVEKEATVVREE